jgi:predicted transcriptional regulator
MKRGAAETFVPAGLVREIEAAAKEERRTPSELVGEAVERYLAERRFIRKDDAHKKIAQGLESLRAGQALDGEAVIAELLAEIDLPSSTP